MSKKKNLNYFENINSVINGLAKNLGLEKGLKISSIANLWGKIVGPRFENTSRIFSIYENNGIDVVVVAVNSSTVAQELTFYKKDILKKIHKIGVNFGFDIKEITFSTKYWKKEDKNNQEQIKKQPTEEDLENVKLPESILKSIKLSMEEKSFFNDELKQRYLNTVIKDLKTRLWMKNNKYPACKNCGITLKNNSFENKSLCPSCIYKKP